MNKVKRHRSKQKLPKAKPLPPSSEPDAEKTMRLAQTTLRPSVNAAAVINEYGKIFGTQDIDALILALQKNIQDMQGGDLSRLDAMLFMQAHSLQAIFTNLSRRAINSEYMENVDRYLRLALKAQSQCRATLETLAEIKNPMAGAYVRQANIAAGHQQVNNGTIAETSPPTRPIEKPPHALKTDNKVARAEETKNPQNKLLEVQDGERLDTRTAGTTSGINSRLETVETIHRP